MISRRQIIRGQPTGERANSAGGQQQVAGRGPASSSSSSSSSSSAGSSSKPSSHRTAIAKMIDKQQLARQAGAASSSANGSEQMGGGSKASAAGSAKTGGHAHSTKKQLQPAQAGDSSDGYLISSSNPYEEYDEGRSWRQQQQHSQQQQQKRGPPPLNNQRQQQQQQQEGGNEAFRQPFDPYSIYSDEEDVWYSEERLFEDHLEEIYNKWPLLDDDIWCKLIIMERNRRIGKAYARVPVVTINGSHELSYDGEKLALNGFDNIDRDDETEECRKRIGKGIKIKVDNIGNILIKRLSKAGVYVKEWINPSKGVSGGSSNSTNGSSGAGVGRSMPSRQQLIKAASMNGGHHQMSSLMNGSTPTSSSGGSSMDTPNDSAICDEVITIGGRLDLNKIYVMFDIKKFQANITQELCRAYPDRRKLEQQCFSIVGLTRDSEDILNLPIWVMVINIVAIEMLNSRFPGLGDRHGLSEFPDSRRLLGPQAPSFVSIFDHAGNNSSRRDMKHQGPPNNKEEDPYSLPANASSSDVKSSINDYSTTSTKNMSPYMDSTQVNTHSSRFYGTPKNVYMHPHSMARPRELTQRHRSKSNYNIYGQAARVGGMTGSGGKVRQSERYNNNSSIYSPGHMLVPHTDQSVPPKLPPRDFVAKKNSQRSKSSSNVNYDDNMSSKYDNQSDNIYSTGLVANVEQESNVDEPKVVRKAKKNRFLESLKSPLAKSGRSTSVMGVQTTGDATNQPPANGNTTTTTTTTKKISKSKGGFSRAKNLRSLLGVGSKSKEPTAASDESNCYVHLDETQTKLSSSSKANDGAETDSVVDSNEEIDDQVNTNSTSSPTTSYNDLDIPTPDYETDENIYALGDAGVKQTSGDGGSSSTNTMRTKRFSTSNNNNNETRQQMSSGQQNKDDLYYSGFRAHVPHHNQHHSDQFNTSKNYQTANNTNNDRMSCISGSAARANSTTNGPTSAANSRYLIRTSRMLAAKMSGREIYGSTLGLQQQQSSLTGSRYRSASMQRYYPSSLSSSSRAAATTSHLHQLNRSHNEMYDPDLGNPYAMSAGYGSSAITPLDDHSQGHYGVTTASSCIGGGGGGGGSNSGVGRRRSVSKLMPVSNRSLASSTKHCDIGRSSSGIYGNNSSSSSSEYADWHPQVRKVNSSGYLNSIFKGHHQLTHKIKTAPSVCNMNHSVAGTEQPMLNHNNNNNNSKTTTAAYGGYNPYANGGGATKPSSQVRNYATSRGLKPLDGDQRGATAGTMPSGSRHQHQPMVASSVMNDPAYRAAYDSSNDSDPSYTNSSDGLDIYDQIGGHPRIGGNHPQHHANQFMSSEVQVGEWENMYDR